MPLSNGDLAPVFETADQRGGSLKVPSGKKTAVFFMRYLGCPLCLKKMDEIKAGLDEFKSAGTDVVVVMQSTPRRVSTFAEKHQVPFTLVSDRAKDLYRLYEVGAGGLRRYLTANVAKESLKATLKGKMHGAFEGDEFQIPACFLVGADGRIHYAYYGRDVADFGDIGELISAAKAAS